MFKILEKSFRTGLATAAYPKAGAKVSSRFRGRPVFDSDVDAAACPTGAITAGERPALDLGRCIFCGECNARMSQDFELASLKRDGLVKKFGDTPGELGGLPQTQQTAGVSPEFFDPTADLKRSGDTTEGIVDVLQAQQKAKEFGDTPGTFSESPQTQHTAGVSPKFFPSTEQLGSAVNAAVRRLLGRALAIREVDAGSCNGCELEINALNNPVYDLERFGIHFVASPRHADMLLVTGPVTRNMELALRKTYDATPAPKLVAAAGACAISGGLFGVNYATRGAVDQLIPVDVYIPGCPPRPEALLHGILLAIGRLRKF